MTRVRGSLKRKADHLVGEHRNIPRVGKRSIRHRGEKRPIRPSIRTYGSSGVKAGGHGGGSSGRIKEAQIGEKIKEKSSTG